LTVYFYANSLNIRYSNVVACFLQSIHTSFKSDRGDGDEGIDAVANV